MAPFWLGTPENKEAVTGMRSLFAIDKKLAFDPFYSERLAAQAPKLVAEPFSGIVKYELAVVLDYSVPENTVTLCLENGSIVTMSRDETDPSAYISPPS